MLRYNIREKELNGTNILEKYHEYKFQLIQKEGINNNISNIVEFKTIQEEENEEDQEDIISSKSKSNKRSLINSRKKSDSYYNNSDEKYNNNIIINNIIIRENQF